MTRKHFRQFGQSRHKNVRVTKIYNTWLHMRGRCNNPTDKDYEHYGERGIKICDEWQDYEAFREWAISSGVRKGLTIDRKDNDGPYSPDNCHWISQSEQNHNKRPHSKTILNEDAVRVIRDSDLPNVVLQRAFRIGRSAIYNVKKRVTWKHVE